MTAIKNLLFLVSWTFCVAIPLLIGCQAVPSSSVPTEKTVPTDGPSAGESRIDEKGVEQVWVPAGVFLMGTHQEDVKALKGQDDVPTWVKAALPSESPAHEVTLSSGYWIDKYEVTNAAFQAFVDDGGYTQQEYWSEEGWAWLSNKSVDELPHNCIEESQPDHPRVCVTWFEAQAYARWRGGDLPTEAQWEYAARGPEALIYPWGNEFDENKANIIDSTGLTPVGNYPDGVSWVQAHDMAGNAMEWVQDWLDRKYYAQETHVDPTGPEIGSRKVEKGGWWGSNPYVARTAYRHYEDPPSYQGHHVGFRVVTP